MPPENGGAPAPVADPFGVPAPQDAPKGDEGGKAGGDDKAVKLTPTEQVAELNRKLGEYQAKELQWGETQKEKDKNMEAMRNAIKDYESGKRKPKSKEGEGGEDNADLPFKEVKFSKDLPKEQLEEMTETEIRLFDQNATTQQAMNALFGQISKTAKTTETVQETAINDTVRELAMVASGNDQKLANEIIENFNMFSDELKKGATKEQLAELVAKSARMMPDYKPPKEQENGGVRKPVTKNDGVADPFGTDAIIAEANKGSDGKYTL